MRTLKSKKKSIMKKKTWLKQILKESRF